MHRKATEQLQAAGTVRGPLGAGATIGTGFGEGMLGGAGGGHGGDGAKEGVCLGRRDRERKAMRAGEKMHIVMFPNDGKEVRISRLA